MAKKKTDPTMATVERLKDESQWKIVRGVPALVPFVGPVTLPDGTVKEVSIDEKDLEETVANYLQRLETTGTVGVITPGHRKPFSQEKDQPAVWGHPMNPRVGTFGPQNKPAVLVDEYYYPNHWDEYCDSSGKSKYPYRSPEYYANSKQLTGLAVLIRDPKLDMGMVTFTRTPEGDCLHFAMEGPIDPTLPPEANPGTGTECPEGVDPEFYENFCKCMECYEGQAGHYQRTEPVSTPAVTPAPASTPVASPPADPQLRDQQAIQFARMQSELDAMKAELAAAKVREEANLVKFSKTDCERRCAQLEYEGYSLSEGWKEEIPILMSRDEAGREAFCNYLRGNRPTGQALMRPEHQQHIRVVESPTLFQREDDERVKQAEVALQFQREQPDLEWDECMEKAAEKLKKKTA